MSKSRRAIPRQSIEAGSWVPALGAAYALIGERLDDLPTIATGDFDKLPPLVLRRPVDTLT
jgi:hypothetical protein